MAPLQAQSRKIPKRHVEAILVQELPVIEGHDSFDTCEPKAVRDV
jgi:hypothetical protein